MSPAVMTVVESRIDHESAARFQEQLLGEVGDGSRVLILDFAAVEVISSVGLRALVVASKKCKPAGGKLALSGLQPLVREVFKITRFDALFPVFDDVDSARAALA
jgi:anti-anti-sigma factor